MPKKKKVNFFFKQPLLYYLRSERNRNIEEKYKITGNSRIPWQRSCRMPRLQNPPRLSSSSRTSVNQIDRPTKAKFYERALLNPVEFNGRELSTPAFNEKSRLSPDKSCHRCTCECANQPVHGYSA